MEFTYKGLTATLERMAVTEDEIDRQLERLKGQEFPELSPEELRQTVAESLQTYYDSRAEEDLLDRLIRSAAETLDYTPSEDDIERGTQAQMDSFTAQLAQRNLTIEAYCSFMNTSEAQIREDIRLDAVQMLKIRAAIERIAELERVEATQEDIQNACVAICRQNQITAEELKELYDEAFAEAVRFSVISEKVLHLVRAEAKITEIPA